MTERRDRSLGSALARLRTDGQLRRGLGRVAWRALGQAAAGRAAVGAAEVRAAIATLSQSSEGRIDVLATRAVAYLAHVIQHVVHQAGLGSTIFYDDDVLFDLGQPFVVLCPHVYPTLPGRYAAFQLEQSVSPRWFTPRTWDRLRRAERVLEYATANIPYLVEHGVDPSRIVHVPISTVPDYRGVLSEVFPHLAWPRQKTIDVMFYGDPHTPRRAAMLDQLRRRFTLRVVDKVFGPDLLRLLASARVVANIHYYEGALLETTRLSESLSLGVPVVSEVASDQDAHAELGDAIRFTPIGDAVAMGDAIAALLRDPRAETAQRAKVEHLVRTDTRFEDSLHALLQTWPE